MTSGSEFIWDRGWRSEGSQFLKARWGEVKRWGMGEGDSFESEEKLRRIKFYISVKTSTKTPTTLKSFNSSPAKTLFLYFLSNDCGFNVIESWCQLSL